MNRLGLFKRAAALALVVPPRTGALVDGHGKLVAVGKPEPPLAPVGFTAGYMDSHGAPCAHTHYATAYAKHTHDPSAHTHWPAHAHTHCICHGNCRGCCR